MITSVSTLKMSREEWLELRRHGIGGSDAAAVLGVSRYKSPFGVYLDKTTEMPDVTTPVMEMGNLLEDYVAKLFEQESGMKVARRNRTYTNSDHPFMLANIDRYVIGQQAGLECKTTTKYSWKGWDTGEIPPEYYWQCQHYMAVLGYKRWFLAVLFRDTGDFRWMQVDRDDAGIDRMIAAESEFWGRVVGKNPPPASGLESETELIDEMYPAESATGESVDLTSLSEIISTRARLAQELKDGKAAMDALDQQIKRAMGTAQEGKAGNFTVSWKACQRNDIDRKKLAAFPDVLAAVSSLSSFRRFEIKEVGA